ncbi:MAG: SDR family oxidoreductase [Leptolyngbya sp. SIO1E4]|nr:SDR family oxidoreductase [Leptolyngbya sp. SIO1E4]
MSQHVLITGASQGAGKATALRFATGGWDVTLAARNPARLDAVAQQIQAMGQQALAVPTDVGKAEQVATLVEKSIATFGQIDALINNAGICLTGPIENTSLDDWHRILDTNLWGCIHTIQAILPTMLNQGRGTIINVGSFGGKMPIPQMTAYCTSKYALTGLTNSLRLELASKGIHVGIVHPGVIKSDFLERAMFRGHTDADARDRQQQMTQLLDASWASQPEDIAKAVWKALAQRQHEVVVGPTAIATELHRLFPQFTQWALSKGANG